MLTHPTTQYSLLLAALAAIRPITKNVNPLICDTPLQTLKVRSYILLTHAALEEYIEELTLEVAKAAVQQFTANKSICIALLGLVSSTLLDEVSVGKAKKRATQDVFNNIDVFAAEALTRFHMLVKGNNGIKRNDQLSLFLPIGVDPEQADSATLAAMDAFGTKRGDIAHKAKITKTHTLSEIESDIATIVSGLKMFDQAACEAL